MAVVADRGRLERILLVPGVEWAILFWTSNASILSGAQILPDRGHQAMESRDSLREEIEHDTRAFWLLLLYLFATVTIAEYAYVVLFSLWIIPIDSLIPVKIASVVGCVLLVAYTLSRVLVIFDSQADSWNRLVAGLFLFFTLGALYGVATSVPELADFLVTASLRMASLPSDLMTKIMISIGMIVVILPFVFLLRIWLFSLAGTIWQIQLNKKKLRGEA